MASVADFRSKVAEAALELFTDTGYDPTSVDDIAQAAGISRSTFFRQFRAKEDVIFADHEALLEELTAYLSVSHPDPWAAVCQAAELVFAKFSERRKLAQKRYHVVQAVPALRDRETIMVSRYERLFSDYLRRALPGISTLDAIRFAAAVTSTHNYVLREMMLDSPAGSLQNLEQELLAVRRIFGVLPPEDPASMPAGDDLVVAVFSRWTPTAEIARRIQSELDGHSA
ncbi:TetR/AcrR family transcriptional regulator [Pseudarthrobacter sp. HLT3-5]|uniref:TetR/AcrR family transcriptional regulator n=1 Tax=Pseudarthrobacter cellobiosi TaxID=2953654 RepID=UPI00208FCDDD|nr:TetR/AcrR family transcriptional regulator [Pseudarthrobacter sp. HLT3-5]MCO4275976.1 TetR/AcrR family transcriptional regulator [Pseudarthrobacter sp. HLT3-5]